MIRGARIAAAAGLALVVSVFGLIAGAPVHAETVVPSAAAAQPLPGQSDQPAPGSRQKLVLDHGHIDAFTPVLDSEQGLRLELKEDVTGLNVMHAPESVLLHVAPAALLEIPEGIIDGLAGDVHHLPLIQNAALIWPGWETQLIVAEYPDANTEFVVSEVDGPGEVFLWSQNTFGEVTSLMLGGGYRFPGTISQPYPAHTHAAWAFTEAGTYTLTVRADVTASNGRVASTRNEDYTFVVGEFDEHLSRTTTSLATDVQAADPGQPVTLAATVAPAGAGAVQFRDETSGALLGHSALAADGTAVFRTAALQPGVHRIIAEYVPTWATDFAPSVSGPVTLEVGGEQVPKPAHEDPLAATEEQLRSHVPGTRVRVTNPSRRAVAGGVVTATVDAPEQRGDWVSVWLHGTEPSWLGWVQLDLDGALAVALPASLDAGDLRVVLKNRDGTVLGWDRLEVGAPDTPIGPEIPVVPQPQPVAPVQECMPQVTLDHGHIDAFTVSAGGGLAVLQVLEDVTGHRVLREAETVLLKVKESAFAQIPGLPGGPAGYVLPLSQHPALIWPGWDTNRTAASGYTDVSIHVTDVSGPGTVSLYTSQGAFGGWRPLLTHGGYALPGTIREPTPAHTHAQWVFEKQGIYVLTAHAVATNPATGASLTTQPHSYVFQVGEVPLGDVFCGLTPHGADDATRVNAAVLQAGQEAVAAQQAATIQERQQRRSGPGGAQSRPHGWQTEGAAGIPVGVAIGIVGGGALLLAGIAGGTIWLLRGIRLAEYEGDSQ